MAVTGAESHQAGESGRGLALGCYFQLQGTRAELTAKAFVHPERGEDEEEEGVCVWREWEGRREKGGGGDGGGRDTGLCSWV